MSADQEMQAQTYEIRRFFREDGKPYEVVVRGLTLAQAQAHCQRWDSRGQDWFDGFAQEGGDDR
jgi:hypothetical protein